MNKQDCLARAEACRHQAKVATERSALYASTFGGADKLTQDALLEADCANEAAKKWDWLASIHPATRNAFFRKGDLPSFIFQYGR